MPTDRLPLATLSRKIARALVWDRIFLATNVNSFLTKGLHLVPVDEVHALLAYGVVPSAIIVYDKDPEILVEALDLYPGIKCVNDDFFAAADTYRGKLQTVCLDVEKNFSIEGYERFIEVMLRLKPSAGAAFYFTPVGDMPELTTIRQRYEKNVELLQMSREFKIVESRTKYKNMMFEENGDISTHRASILYEYATIALIIRFQQMNKLACGHCMYLPAYRTLEGDPGLGLVMYVDQKRLGESKHLFYKRRMRDAMHGAFSSDGKEVTEEVFKRLVLHYYESMDSIGGVVGRVAQMFGIEEEKLQSYIKEGSS